MADDRAENHKDNVTQDDPDANSQPGGRPQASEEKDGAKKPSLLERYPIIRYVLIAALVAGIIAAIVWYMNYRASDQHQTCLLYTSPSPRDGLLSRMPSSA